VSDVDQRQGLGMPPRQPGPVFVRSHRRPGWLPWVAGAAAYGVGGVAAHLLKPWLPELTLSAYAVAFVGGLAFILRYMQTDWRAHPWGRHVMAFMVCMELVFALAVSRRIFGDWLGLEESLFLASCTFAGIVWWRERLQARGDRQARQRAAQGTPGAD
jgi:hypothetical protein